ncbi:DMT family transporter, partial [Tyzzerella sp. OttesenSCG-928-J15]|nr:DMT family transporter [Tyzzerella sp. OttesenSCG-928-J15]
MSLKMDSKKANILLAIAAFVWGSGFVASQYALDAGITPFQLICGRMFVASVFLSIVFRKNLKTITKGEIKAGVLIGIFLFLGFTFQTYGLKYTTPSVNAFVTAVYVILTPFIRWYTFKEKPDTYSNIGAVMTVIGIGLISLTDGFNISLGIPLTLICAVAYAFQVVYTDKYTKI